MWHICKKIFYFKHIIINNICLTISLRYGLCQVRRYHHLTKLKDGLMMMMKRNPFYMVCHDVDLLSFSTCFCIVDF